MTENETSCNDSFLPSWVSGFSASHRIHLQLTFTQFCTPVTVCSFARGKLCGSLTQMQSGFQPSSSRTTGLEKNNCCCSSLMEMWGHAALTHRLTWLSLVVFHQIVSSLYPFSHLISRHLLCQRACNFTPHDSPSITHWSLRLISHRWETLTSWRARMTWQLWAFSMSLLCCTTSGFDFWTTAAFTRTAVSNEWEDASKQQRELRGTWTTVRTKLEQYERGKDSSHLRW